MSDFVSWSYSTVNTLKQCNRKYYFASVLATHGRKVPLRRKAYELRCMQNLQMWRGSVVDKFMELMVIPAIRDKKELDFEMLSNQAVEMAATQFKYSQNQFYKNPEQKKGDVDSSFCILNIHEVNMPFQESELVESYSIIKEAIKNIPTIQMPDGKLLIDFLKECNGLTPNVNNYIVEIEGTRLKPQMDLLAMSNWKPVVIDWKLSASYTSDYSRQLIICGLTVYLKRQQRTDKPAYIYEDIKLYEVNLLKCQVKEHEFIADRINEVIDYMTLTSRDIRLLTKSDDKEIDIENFELTDDEGLCATCNFQTLCSYLLINNNQYDEKSYIESVQNTQLV
ncbi:MAG: PD-(D/E)XK nuclease family protein [Sphingobacteriaceae bacterium]|nr:PD-(D/E)XK nuclease family protein [Sphingobacteriaceae bacterium]